MRRRRSRRRRSRRRRRRVGVRVTRGGTRL
ncbi:hypothetical protein [Dipodfec virus UOA04_Rod_931]|nr:hypothetical protein [Dipodfec virus UOA04_Rod_931]